MTRPVLTVLTVVALFGVLVPWSRRYDFLDPVMLAAYFCLPVVLVAPMAADALAGGAESAMGTVRRALLVAFYGWGLGMVIVAAGLITVNAASGHGHLLLPAGGLLAAGAAFSLAAALTAVLATGFLAHFFSARSARTIPRLLFLVLLVGMVLLARGASAEWTAAFWRHMTTAELTRGGFRGAAALAAVDAVALSMLARVRKA